MPLASVRREARQPKGHREAVPICPTCPTHRCEDSPSGAQCCFLPLLWVPASSELLASDKL